MRVGVVVSARTASTRLPGKALLNLMGYPIIIFILSRLSKINHNLQIILATTDLKSDDILTEIVLKHGFMVFRGSCEDVVKRHIDLAEHYGFDFIVRITGDCPFVNGELVEFCYKQFNFDGSIFLGTTKNSFPQGLDCEIISVKALKEYWPVMTDWEKRAPYFKILFRSIFKEYSDIY